MSEEEQDEDGGTAIPPPAKRKVRGKETHSTIMIALTYVLESFVTHCRESGFVSMHHLKHRLL